MEKEEYYLQVQLDGGHVVHAVFDDINNRDGCDISLGLYRMNLGPITREVWNRMLRLFHGRETEV